MHGRILPTFVCLVVIGSSLAATGRPPVTPVMKQAVKVYNKLGEKVFKDLSKRGGNILISPLSVSAIVGMVYLEAKGETVEELERILDIKKHFQSSEEFHMGFTMLIESLRRAAKDFHMEFVNGIFIGDGMPVLERYQRDVQKYYLSDLYSAAFIKEPGETMEELNGWVREGTNYKIPQFLEGPLPSNISLVALNAVHFKGYWQQPFHTKRVNFSGVSGSTEVDMMHQDGTFVYVDTKEYQAVELPYESEEVVMVIFLPKNQNLAQTINYAEIRVKLGSVIKQNVELSIPKFTLSEAYDLRVPLQNIGLLQIFDASRVNLTGISRAKGTILVSPLHQAVIGVNGKESSPATATGGIPSHSVSSTKSVFKANRPFIFFIEDLNTNAVLFVGSVNDIDNTDAGVKGQG